MPAAGAHPAEAIMRMLTKCFGHRRVLVAAAVVLPLAAGTMALGAAGARADDQAQATSFDVVVDSTADDGSAGTLRAAFDAANTLGGSVTIGITVVGTIHLTSSLPGLNQNTTIVGGGVGQTVIDSAGFRFLGVGANVDLVATDLTLTGSHNGDMGAAIRRSGGTTTLQRVEITGNDGGSGLIFVSNSSVVTLVDSNVHDNSGAIIGSDWGNTPGGDTAASPYADSAYSTRVYVTNSTFAANTGCVIDAQRFVTVTGSTFSGDSSLCLDGLNRKTIRNSTFTGTGGGAAIVLNKNAAWDVPVILDGVNIGGYSVAVANAYSTLTITGSTICSNGVAYTEWDAAQTIVISGDSQVGDSCPPPATTTTTAAVTTTTEPATTTTAASTTVAPTTTSAAPTTTTTTTTSTTTTTTPIGVSTTLAAPSPSTTIAPTPLGPIEVTPVTGLPGNGAYSVDRSGSVERVDLRVTDGHHVLATAGTTLTLTGAAPSVPDLPLLLDPNGTAIVEGTGFLPGSPVHAWMFSTPTAVGDAVVGADGSFRIAATVPSSLPAGSHTLVVSGVRLDGTAQAVGLGVSVAGDPTTTTPRAGSLPVTGSDPIPLVGFGVVLLIVGAFLRLQARRRPVPSADRLEC